jgi:hypothetical protein
MVENSSLPKTEAKNQKKLNTYAKYSLNALILVSFLLIGYFSRNLIPGNDAVKDADRDKQQSKPKRVYQLDVLNGCGVKGAAGRFTNYLRANGYDVVEMKNYKTFQIPQTLVIDRVGNLEAARRVAEVLGISGHNIVQQINPDYFVDVSIIIGKDYHNLRPLN